MTKAPARGSCVDPAGAGAVPASVVIVSRGRPRALSRCLTGVGQLFHHPFEVVVVADPEGCAAVEAHPLGPRVRLVPFDEPNISAARNAGIAHAGGAAIAFLDDDAVPEPTWLSRLVAPLADADATGGFVRGRNGISFQWTARIIDRTGAAHPVATEGTAPVAPVPPPGAAVKTEGTNMAVRRDVLVALGGFDPRFRFYLDESDLNLRLAQAGRRTVLVPLAQVHHGFAESARRRSDRVPRSLFDIGASAEVFWATHARPDEIGPARRALLAEQRARMLRHMVAGGCEPRDVGRLLATLEAGFDAGRARLGEARRATFPPPPPFLGLHRAPPDTGMEMLGGAASEAPALLARARAIVAQGGRASVVLLDKSPRRHRVEFTDDGIWIQTGGLWGRSDRDRAAWTGKGGVPERVKMETDRVRHVRCCEVSAG